MAEVVELFRSHGPAVFSPRELPSGPVSRLLDLSRSVLGPKYSGAALREHCSTSGWGNAPWPTRCTRWCCRPST